MRQFEEYTVVCLWLQIAGGVDGFQTLRKESNSYNFECRDGGGRKVGVVRRRRVRTVGIAGKRRGLV